MSEYEEVGQDEFTLMTCENVGDTVTGEIIAKNEGRFGPYWTIRLEDGTEVFTPSHKVLQNRLMKVAIGSNVKIEKLESLAPKVRGQNATTMYKVSVKR